MTCANSRSVSGKRWDCMALLNSPLTNGFLTSSSRKPAEILQSISIFWRPATKCVIDSLGPWYCCQCYSPWKTIPLSCTCRSSPQGWSGPSCLGSCHPLWESHLRLPGNLCVCGSTSISHLRLPENLCVCWSTSITQKSPHTFSFY